MATAKIEDGIRAYLDGLGVSDKPVVDREAVKALREQIKSESDTLNRLKLLTALEEAQQGSVPDRSGDEAVFIANAREWAEKEGISPTAFQALGVPDDVLKKAGLEVAPAKSPKKASSGGGGSRQPRFTNGEEVAAAKKLGKGWTVKDLGEALDRDPATARNYLNRMLKDGVVVEAGEGEKPERGRAPKLYAIA